MLRNDLEQIKQIFRANFYEPKQVDPGVDPHGYGVDWSIPWVWVKALKICRLVNQLSVLLGDSEMMTWLFFGRGPGESFSVCDQSSNLRMIWSSWGFFEDSGCDRHGDVNPGIPILRYFKMLLKQPELGLPFDPAETPILYTWIFQICRISAFW